MVSKTSKSEIDRLWDRIMDFHLNGFGDKSHITLSIVAGNCFGVANSLGGSGTATEPFSSGWIPNFLSLRTLFGLGRFFP